MSSFSLSPNKERQIHSAFEQINGYRFPQTIASKSGPKEIFRPKYGRQSDPKVRNTKANDEYEAGREYM